LKHGTNNCASKCDEFALAASWACANGRCLALGRQAALEVLVQQAKIIEKPRYYSKIRK
jgi:hypothetical protein